MLETGNWMLDTGCRIQDPFSKVARPGGANESFKRTPGLVKQTRGLDKGKKVVSLRACELVRW
ncbi:MAG: hypothetical protein M0Q38_17535 [Bacteroidales bacterium]|nr:hypothetical protein [Bacteroidales bacterium]